MRSKVNNIKKEHTFVVDLLIGTAVFIIALTLGTVTATIFVNKEYIGESRIEGVAHIIQFLAALLGGMYVTLMTKRRIVPVCAAQLLCFLTVLFAGTAMLFEGQYSKIGMTVLMLSVGCICSILIAFFIKKRKHMHIPKKVYR